jgi:hypothetical protein
MRIEDKIIQLLIESFAEECLEEMAKQKHPENGPFNFGLASADAAVRRIKTKYIEKLNPKEDVNNQVF